ncbi:hypothetical protein ACNHUS_35335 [Actinomycetes bacterium M1A6_2h]
MTDMEDKDETNERGLAAAPRDPVEPSERAGVDFRYGENTKVTAGVPTGPGGARSGLVLSAVLLAVCLVLISAQSITTPVAILGSAMVIAIILICTIVYKMKL